MKEDRWASRKVTERKEILRKKEGLTKAKNSFLGGKRKKSKKVTQPGKDQTKMQWEKRTLVKEGPRGREGETN